MASPEIKHVPEMCRGLDLPSVRTTKEKARWAKGGLMKRYHLVGEVKSHFLGDNSMVLPPTEDQNLRSEFLEKLADLMEEYKVDWINMGWGRFTYREESR